ncbi:TonB-dependent receptor [Gelidibacter japonicus]|jgi:TonB-linked SusC/RagA family outer membrane protein|uniref:SusC/RagA family TonB-linked outer membrane protein n=1 Tax=Gelidibacter japonicus TaxID=1962232 RepID=UPI002020C890|nr:TonB-dependent receptor [Gelidibacter japonicus]MCL8007566.1 TonB-dependent receptor [Gelidibacter japonicus]
MKARLILFLFFLFSYSVSQAQELTVTGTVTSAEDGFPVPGVNVLIKGTSRGTSTDFDGNYSLKVNRGEIVEFSSLGFKTVTVTIANQTTLNISLEADIEALGEIVVVGYGSQRKADLTGAITTVQAEDIERTPTSNVMQSLQGKVAGVQVVGVGSPGDSPKVRLRGVGTFDGSNNPLYVVNGMFYDNIDFLNTSDIESVSVLKDASSSAIFGQKAAGGVIIIQTKSGKFEKKPEFVYNGYSGYQFAQNVVKMANTEQFATMAYESGSSTDIANIQNAIQRYGRSRINPNLPDVNTDWYKEILRPATISSHSIGVNGGGENATYSLGANYFSQDGIMDMKNEYERFNIRSNVDIKLSERFKMGTNMVFSNATKYNAENGAWFQAYFAVPTLPVYDPLNTEATPVAYSDATKIGYRGSQNPFPTMRFNENQLKIRKLLTNIYAEYYIVPEKLSIKTSYYHDYSSIEERNVRMPYFISQNSQRETSSIRKAQATYSNQIWDNVITYKDVFGDHNITVLGGTSYRDEAVHNLSATGEDITGIDFESSWYLDFADPESFNGNVRDNGGRVYGVSYFGRAEYSFMDRYLINATIRAEGDSKFTANNWLYTPAFGLGWVISEENFLKDNNVFNFLKLRASYGKLGNGSLGRSSGTRTVSIVQTDIGDQPVSGIVSTSNFSNLEWEVTEEKDFGISARMFNSRLTLEADYFIRTTDNAVIPVIQPISNEIVRKNAGEIRNQGLEVSLDYNQTLNDNWRFNIGANISTLKNEVISLAENQEYIDGGSAEFRQRTRVGDPIRAFFGYEVLGVYQNATEIQNDPIAMANNLVPGDLRYRDVNGDGVLDADDRVILGSYLPNFMYGGNLGISYKNFDFSVNVSGQSGNKILNRKRGEVIFTSDTNMDADLAINRWHGEGTSNSYPSSAGLRKSWNQKLSTYFIEDGSYFRIQNIQLSYTVKPGSLLGKRMPETRLTFTAERPFTFFKYNGFDPEVQDGVDRQTYPVPAVYTMGINIKI